MSSEELSFDEDGGEVVSYSRSGSSEDLEMTLDPTDLEFSSGVGEGTSRPQESCEGGDDGEGSEGVSVALPPISSAPIENEVALTGSAALDVLDQVS